MPARRFGCSVVLVAVAVVLSLGGCGSTGETSAVCGRAPELESSLVAADSAIEQLSAVPARQLQSIFAVLLGSLDTLVEVAPPTVADSFVHVNRQYRELSIALQNVDWEGSVGQSDSAVQAAVANLTRNDNVEALTTVRTFVKNECSLELTQTINKSPGDAVNLPSPSIDPEPQADLNTGFDDENSALRSYGYFVAEQFGLSLDADQGLCVGTSLTDKAFTQGAQTNAQYDNMVVTVFGECHVNIGSSSTTVG